MSRIVLDFSAKPPYMIFEWPSLGGHSRSGRDCVLNDLVKYKEEREKWKKRERERGVFYSWQVNIITQTFMNIQRSGGGVAALVLFLPPGSIDRLDGWMEVVRRKLCSGRGALPHLIPRRVALPPSTAHNK